MLNHRELNKASKLVVGDEYFIKNRSCTAIYLGKTENKYCYFATTRGGWMRGTSLVGSFLDYYNQFLADKVSKFLLNIAKCSIVVIDSYSVKNTCIKVSYNNAIKPNNQVNILMTDSVKLALTRVVKANEAGSSNRLIAQFLLSKLPSDLCNLEEVGMLAIDVSIEGTKLVSLTDARMSKLISNNGYSVQPQAIDKMAQPVKIGKLVKKITGEMFTNVQIEKFSHAFNSYVETSAKYEFDIVKGKPIIDWYNISSYTTEEHGTLHNSCMRYSKNTDQVAFYAAHPNCSMLIIKKDGKLHGRALLWTLHDGKRYLDRIYSSSEIVRAGMLKYAKEKGIEYFYENQSSVKESILVETDLNKKDYGKFSFPYLDSFGQVTGDLKYLVMPRTNSNTSAEELIKLYGKGMLDLDTGSIDTWFGKNKGLICPEGKVRITNFLDGEDLFEDESKCVFVKNNYSYFRKAHVSDTGKPLSGNALLKVRDEELNKKKAEAVAA